jgi:general secretion pathway protein D
MKSQVLTALTAASLALGAAAKASLNKPASKARPSENPPAGKHGDYAQKAINKGTEAMINQTTRAPFLFQERRGCLPSGGAASHELRETALDGFCRAAVKLSEQRISEGRYQDATTTITVVLDKRYAPDYGPAMALERKLKDPTRFNRAYTPGFVANVEEVKQLLLEADGFYASGRFDLAFKRYEQVLNIDKYNIAARRGMERVNGARQRCDASLQ